MTSWQPLINPREFGHIIGEVASLTCILEDNVQPANNPVTGAIIYITIAKQDGEYLNFISGLWENTEPTLNHMQALNDENNGLYSFDFDPTIYGINTPQTFIVEYFTDYWGWNQVDKERHNFYA